MIKTFLEIILYLKLVQNIGYIPYKRHFFALNLSPGLNFS